MSVLLINQGWTDNLGDAAINEILEKSLSEFDPISIPYAPITAQVTHAALRKICNLYKMDIRYKKWIRNKLDQINGPIEAAVVGGGELLAENMNFNSAMKCWVKELYKRNVPIYVWGVGGGYVNPLYRIRYKNALQKVDMICTRDAKSRQIVKECYGRNAEIYPDVVFANGVTVSGDNRRDDQKIVLCNVLSYNFYANSRKACSKNQFFNEWKQLLENEVSANTQVLFSATTKEDRATTEEFAKYYLGSSAKVVFPESLEACRKQLDSVDCVISGRMHAMIMAMLAGCKCVPFVWKDKLEVFKKEYVSEEVSINDIQKRAVEGLEVLKTQIRKGR